MRGLEGVDMTREEVGDALAKVGFELVTEHDQYSRLVLPDHSGSAYARPRARTADDLAATGTVKNWLAERAEPSSVTKKDWQWRGVSLSRLMARLRK